MDFPVFSRGKSPLSWELVEVPNDAKVPLIHDGVENLADAGIDFSMSSFDAGCTEFTIIIW